MSGSERALVGSEDFKSFCRALITSGVGSIPTRSRQDSSSFSGLLTLLTVVLLAHSPAYAAAGAESSAAVAESTASPAPVRKAPAPVDSTGQPAVPVPAPAADSTAGVWPDTSAAPELRHRGLRADDAGETPAPQARKGAARKPPKIWWTTIRSGIVPGWGQMANRKPLKAALLFGAWSACGAGAWGAELDRRDAVDRLNGGSDPALVAAVNDAVDRRNQYYWFMGLTALYGMLDAYVDVHFWNYEEEWSAVVAPGPDGPLVALRARF